jgi:hypothetical protein
VTWRVPGAIGLIGRARVSANQSAQDLRGAIKNAYWKCWKFCKQASREQIAISPLAMIPELGQLLIAIFFLPCG